MRARTRARARVRVRVQEKGEYMDIKKEIRKLAGTMTVSDYELFSSQQFYHYAKGLVEGLLTGRTTVPKLEFAHMGYETAYTNGGLIHVCTTGPLVTTPVNQQQRFLNVLGLLCHECAHCLYMDFNASKRADKSIKNGYLWPENPDVNTPEESEALAGIEDLLLEPRTRKIMAYIIGELENIIDDFHDEACLKANFGQMVCNAIDGIRHTMNMSATPLETMLSEKISDVQLFFCMLLQYIYEDDFIALKEETVENNEICQEIKSMAKIIDRARYSNDMKVRYACINQMLIRMYPYLKEELDSQEQQESQGSSDSGTSGDGAGSNGSSADTENTENAGTSTSGGSSGGQSGNQTSPNDADSVGPNTGTSSGGTYSDEAIQNVLDQLQEAVNNAGQGNNVAPQGRKTAAGAKSADATGGKDSGSAEETENTENSMLNTLLNQIKTEKAEEKLETQLASEMVESARMGLSEEDKQHLNMTRILEIPDGGKESYLEILREVEMYSRNMQRRIKDILKNLNYDGTVRKQYGRIIRPQEAYRVDGQYFYKKQRPADLPDLAVAIVLDCSGSMSGYKIHLCRKAGILLEDFCSGLQVPFFMAGHDSWGRKCDMRVAVPFERASAKDKYRIMSLEDGGCNRDGLALKAAVNLLGKRPEQAKLLFMISDGKPTAYASDEAALEDIREGLTQASRKKIQVIACGIDEDKAQIREIYGESRFLAVDDLSRMPQKLVSIIKRNMLKNA